MSRYWNSLRLAIPPSAAPRPRDLRRAVMAPSPGALAILIRC